MLRLALRQIAVRVAILTVAFAAWLPAQTVVGVVTDSASRNPIAGAVVQLLTADGVTLARVLSNARGEFVVRSPGGDPGSQLRVVRIGFRPQVLPLPQPDAQGIRRVAVVMPQFTTTLRPVEVTSAQCRRQRGPSPLEFIEQARAGLLTTIVSRDQKPATVRRLGYSRSYDDAGVRVVEQRVQIDSAAAASPTTFSAVHDAEAFVRRGFAEERDGVATYFAPDADVLLDDRFAAGYCFRIVRAGRNRPNQVGIGFTPADQRRGRIDVDGTLWIDTSARELREIEFRYLDLLGTRRGPQPGGSLVYRAMPNGIVVVERWTLNIFGLKTDSTRLGLRPGIPGLRSFRSEIGGELIEASWPDSVRWRGRLGTIQGSLRRRDGRPAPFVMVAIVGTPYRAESDESGAFRIDDVYPGEYSASVIDPRLLTIDVTIPTPERLTVGRDTLRATITASTARDYILDRCEEITRVSRARAGVVALGRALREDGTPIVGARWSLRMDSGAGFVELAENGRSGSEGLLPFCGALVRGAVLEFVVTPDGGTAQTQRLRLDADANVAPVIFPREP